MDKNKLVENIEIACKAKNEKTTPACINAGVGKSFISDIKRGQTPSVEKLAQLAAYLGVTTSELLGEDPPQRDGDRRVQDEDIKAAFWGGEKDLSPEEIDALWKDVIAYKKFVTERKRNER